MLDGKSLIVTGAASGIGRAAAQIFAGYGAYLTLADVNEAGLQETADLLATNGPAPIVQPADVTSPEQMRALVEAAREQFGVLHGAFNNAGIEGLNGRMLPTAQYPDDAFDQVIRVNLTGLFNALKAELPALEAAGGGAVVNTASVMGWLAAPGMPAYSAAKHGVVGLTRTCALEYAARNIRVNAVMPGAIETPMLLDRGFKANPGFRDQAVALHPLGRLGKATEVAEAAAWLLSDRSSFTTGHTLAVDGGFSVA